MPSNAPKMRGVILSFRIFWEQFHRRLGDRLLLRCRCDCQIPRCTRWDLTINYDAPATPLCNWLCSGFKLKLYYQLNRSTGSRASRSALETVWNTLTHTDFESFHPFQPPCLHHACIRVIPGESACASPALLSMRSDYSVQWRNIQTLTIDPLNECSPHVSSEDSEIPAAGRRLRRPRRPSRSTARHGRCRGSSSLGPVVPQLWSDSVLTWKCR
jgi:hypothetical protein